MIHPENLCRLISECGMWKYEASRLYDAVRAYLLERAAEDLDCIRFGAVSEFYPEMLEAAPLLGTVATVWGVVRVQDAIREEAGLVAERREKDAADLARHQRQGHLYGSFWDRTRLPAA